MGLGSYSFFQVIEMARAIWLKKYKGLVQISKVRRAEYVLWADEKIFFIEVAHNSQSGRQLIGRIERPSV